MAEKCEEPFQFIVRFHCLRPLYLEIHIFHAQFVNQPPAADPDGDFTRHQRQERQFLLHQFFGIVEKNFKHTELFLLNAERN